MKKFVFSLFLLFFVFGIFPQETKPIFYIRNFQSDKSIESVRKSMQNFLMMQLTLQGSERYSFMDDNAVVELLNHRINIKLLGEDSSISEVAKIMKFKEMLTAQLSKNTNDYNLIVKTLDNKNRIKNTITIDFYEYQIEFFANEIAKKIFNPSYKIRKNEAPTFMDVSNSLSSFSISKIDISKLTSANLGKLSSQNLDISKLSSQKIPLNQNSFSNLNISQTKIENLSGFKSGSEAADRMIEILQEVILEADNEYGRKEFKNSEQKYRRTLDSLSRISDIKMKTALKSFEEKIKSRIFYSVLNGFVKKIEEIDKDYKETFAISENRTLENYNNFLNQYEDMQTSLKDSEFFSRMKKIQNNLGNRVDFVFLAIIPLKLKLINQSFNEKRYKEAGDEYLALSREVKTYFEEKAYKKENFQDIYKDLLNRYDLSYNNYFLVKISEIDDKFKEKEYKIAGDEYLALSKEVRDIKDYSKKRNFQNIYKDLLNRYDLSYNNYFLVKIGEIDNKFKEKEYKIAGDEYLVLSREVKGIKDYSKKRDFRNIYRNLLNRYVNSSFNFRRADSYFKTLNFPKAHFNYLLAWKSLESELNDQEANEIVFETIQNRLKDSVKLGLVHVENQVQFFSTFADFEKTSYELNKSLGRAEQAEQLKTSTIKAIEQAEIILDTAHPFWISKKTKDKYNQTLKNLNPVMNTSYADYSREKVFWEEGLEKLGKLYKVRLEDRYAILDENFYTKGYKLIYKNPFISVFGDLKKTLNGHNHDVYSVTYSPDGKTLVSSSKDDTIKFWDVKTGRLKKTLKGHSDDVRSIIYSPDGKTSSFWFL